MAIAGRAGRAGCAQRAGHLQVQRTVQRRRQGILGRVQHLLRVGLRPHHVFHSVALVGALQRIPPPVPGVHDVPAVVPQRLGDGGHGLQPRAVHRGGGAAVLRLLLVHLHAEDTARGGGPAQGRRHAAGGDAVLVCLRDAGRHSARPLRRLALPAAAHALRGWHEDAQRRADEGVADGGALRRDGRRYAQQRHQGVPRGAVRQRPQVLQASLPRACRNSAVGAHLAVRQVGAQQVRAAARAEGKGANARPAAQGH